MSFGSESRTSLSREVAARISSAASDSLRMRVSRRASTDCNRHREMRLPRQRLRERTDKLSSVCGVMDACTVFKIAILPTRFQTVSMQTRINPNQNCFRRLSRSFVRRITGVRFQWQHHSRRLDGGLLVSYAGVAFADPFSSTWISFTYFSLCHFRRTSYGHYLK